MKTEKYEIKWEYHYPIQSPRLQTLCQIKNTITDNDVSFGFALCSEKDRFCRDTGRKLSLARAMKSAGLSKEERAELWNVYRDTKPGGRW